MIGLPFETLAIVSTAFIAVTVMLTLWAFVFKEDEV